MTSKTLLLSAMYTAKQNFLQLNGGNRTAFSAVLRFSIGEFNSLQPIRTLCRSSVCEPGRTILIPLSISDLCVIS